MRLPPRPKSAPSHPTRVNTMALATSPRFIRASIVAFGGTEPRGGFFGLEVLRRATPAPVCGAITWGYRGC
jgi:hypothetical protein